MGEYLRGARISFRNICSLTWLGSCRCPLACILDSAAHGGKWKFCPVVPIEGRGLYWENEHEDSSSCQQNYNPARYCYQKCDPFHQHSSERGVCVLRTVTSERHVTTNPHPAAFGLKSMSLGGGIEPGCHSGSIGSIPALQ